MIDLRLSSAASECLVHGITIDRVRAEVNARSDEDPSNLSAGALEYLRNRETLDRVWAEVQTWYRTLWQTTALRCNEVLSTRCDWKAFAHGETCVTVASESYSTLNARVVNFLYGNEAFGTVTSARQVRLFAPTFDFAAMDRLVSRGYRISDTASLPRGWERAQVKKYQYLKASVDPVPDSTEAAASLICELLLPMVEFVASVIEPSLGRAS